MAAFARRLAPVASLALILFTAAHFVIVFAPGTGAVPGLIRASLAALIIACGLFMQRRGQRVLTALLLLGALASILAKGFTVQIFLGLSTMAVVIPIIILAPVAGFLFEYRPYGQNLLAATHRWMKSALHLHGVLTVVSHLLSAAVNLGALAILYPLLRQSVRDDGDARTVSISLLRGYVPVIFWAPTAPILAIALDFLRQPLVAILPVGILMLCVYLLISVLVEQRLRHLPSLPVSLGQPDRALLWEFAVAMGTFVGGLMLLERWSQIGMVTLVPIYGILFTVAAFLLRRDPGALLRRSRRYWQAELHKKSAESAAVLSAGFFLASVRAAGLDAYIEQTLAWLGSGSGYEVLLVLPLAIIALGAIGVPATVTAVVLLGVLSGHDLPVAPALLVAAVTLGAATVQVAGPVVVPTFLLASLNGRPVLTTGFRWNIGFALTQFAVMELLLQVLRWWW